MLWTPGGRQRRPCLSMRLSDDFQSSRVCAPSPPATRGLPLATSHVFAVCPCVCPGGIPMDDDDEATGTAALAAGCCCVLPSPPAPALALAVTATTPLLPPPRRWGDGCPRCSAGLGASPPPAAPPLPRPPCRDPPANRRRARLSGRWRWCRAPTPRPVSAHRGGEAAGRAPRYSVGTDQAGGQGARAQGDAGQGLRRAAAVRAAAGRVLRRDAGRVDLLHLPVHRLQAKGQARRRLD